MSFMVIEGLDGSGKSTQMELLRSYLDRLGRPFRYLHFPRLEQGVYGKLIARFLRGEMGKIDQVDPYLVALIFAGDRADAADTLRSWIDQGNMVILDRYVYSNIAFQCAKLGSADEQHALRDWILELEYRQHRIPRPDINLFLDVPTDFIAAQLNSSRKGADRDYLKGEQDIHEQDMSFQEKVREVYLSLENHVRDLRIIKCGTGENGMQSPEEIFEMIKDYIEI